VGEIERRSLPCFRERKEATSLIVNGLRGGEKLEHFGEKRGEGVSTCSIFPKFNQEGKRGEMGVISSSREGKKSDGEGHRNQGFFLRLGERKGKRERA